MESYTTAMTDTELKQLCQFIYQKTGIVMTEAKRALLINRLGKRLEKHQCKNYGEYFLKLSKALEKDPIYLDFISAVTTNETYFFRAPKIWEYFKNKFLPEWWQSTQGKRTLSMWCGASSSGEEPFTIGILCQEFAEKHPTFRWNLLASDLSPDMIAQCNTAVYSGRAIDQVDPKLLKKYFLDVPQGKEVSKEIRKNIKFIRHKLQDAPPGKNFDIVFIRNVMIYFDAPTKEVVLSRARESLRPDGVFIIGESEGLLGLKSEFETIQPSIFRLGSVVKSKEKQKEAA